MIRLHNFSEFNLFTYESPSILTFNFFPLLLSSMDPVFLCWCWFCLEPLTDPACFPFWCFCCILWLCIDKEFLLVLFRHLYCSLYDCSLFDSWIVVPISLFVSLWWRSASAFISERISRLCMMKRFLTYCGPVGTVASFLLEFEVRGF